ncbi:12287_t:CDS:1 [Ambispora leptoticha]|uniref:12287_t:CDS:1 n=1 Tax=Ambispora leptoticha TaxID=144679 RepID=A0A9N9B556_9GLOM|nr:12287_t:CDS:1 [Ambispora leptoticha]
MESSSDAVDAAVARMAELLRSPDDLVKISLLRKRLAKEKATIDAQLKTGVKAQLDNTQEGLETLTSSRKQMLTIKENMCSIDRLCSSAQDMIDHFPWINKISQIHRNFVATEETIDRLQEMYQRIDQIQDMLDHDKQTILGPAENLLFIHYQLFRLEEFRESSMYQAKSCSHDVIETLKNYFERLDEFSAEFNEYLWILTKNIISLAETGRGSVIVRLIKVIESEERADERAKLAEQALHSHQDLADKFKSVQKSPRVIKSFRTKFQNKIHESISDTFERFYDDFKDDPISMFDNADFIYKDLLLVIKEIVPRFPKKYNIFSIYVLEYHRHVYNILDKITKSDPDAGTILRIIRWVREYYKTMKKDIRITEELLEPPLLNGEEQGLIDDYLKLIRRKLEEWMNNLMDGETKDFTERSKPPEMDGDKLYGLSGAVIMFQMVNQQIDVAAESGQAKILADVVKECSEVMIATQQQWMQLLKAEFKRQIDKKEEAPGGFVEYVIALANDQIRCANFTDDVVTRLEPLLSEKYRNQINDNLNEAANGFLAVARACTQTLLDQVFHDLKQPFGQLYTSYWYQEDPMALIIETIKDYTRDFQNNLQNYLLDKLMTDTLSRFMIAWIEALRNKGAKFKMPECLDRITNDVRTAFGFFRDHISQQDLENTFDVYERIHSLLASSRKTIFLEYYNMKKAYGDVPVSLIEDILSKRDDLEKSQFKEIIENIKTKQKEAPEYTGEPTIFSKISS